MKNYILIAFVFCQINLFSQQKNNDLIPFLDGNKYGFANAEKKIVIPAKFDFVYPFFSDYELTMVVVDGKPFMINRKGKKIFDGTIDYLKLKNFNDLLSLTPSNPEFIDLQKNCVVDSCPTFNISTKLNDGNTFDKLSNLYVVSDLKKVLLIDEKGKRKSELYDKIRHIAFGELEYCITEDSTLHKKGLLDKNGKVLLNCTYDDIIYKGAGVFIIADNNVSHDFKVILENKAEQETTGQDNLKGNGLQIKRKDSKMGVIDSIGNTLISFTYDRLYPVKGNKFLFLKGSQTGIINSKEEIVFEDNISSNQNQKSGRQAAAPYFAFTDDLFFFNINNKWVLIDLNGKKLENQYDCMYVDYQKLTSGFAGVCMNGKIGVVNKNAAFTIPPVYDEIICLSENQTFLARTNNQWTWLSTSGQLIIDKIDAFSYILKDYLFVFKGGKWYFVDGVGKGFLKE